MHYVGMLAFRLSVPVEYDWPTVVISLLAAIFASAIALFVVSRERMGLHALLTGGLLMGSAIAGMHYIGMAAMRLPAMCHYSPVLLVLSVVLAVLISSRFGADVQIARRNRVVELAATRECSGNGGGNPGHALHRYGGRELYPFLVR
jgi:NO-binding membrane sensor protein with MHYT domain